MRSHVLHMVLYSLIVAVFLGLLFRSDPRERLKFGATIWLVMVGGALVMAYLMYPFPR